MTQSANELANQQSLYLKQHKDNPVHWRTFSPSALLEAKTTDRPIFLSIGYSSCHWCHVMAHESFDDLETAKILNENFIPIKVDREEYPDLDSYYQKTCQFFTGNGGWPLSAFLLPDMRAFFAGTYFPKVRNADRPSFKDILNELVRAYRDERDKVISNAEQVEKALSQNIEPKDVQFEGHFPSASSILEAMEEHRDKKHGGYGQAPKFPHFTFFEWASEHILEGVIAKEQGQFIVDSIDSILSGGITDHVRGGIHRYSTDEEWLVPHFEKMLYDQAGFLSLLAKASLYYPTPLLADALNNTLEYLHSEMLGEHYFFSAQDADSEGREGLYFTFEKQELESLIQDSKNEKLTQKQEDLIKWHKIRDTGNFEGDLNVISLDKSFIDEWLKPDNWEAVRLFRKELLNDRKKRIPPATDNKGLASWNFMLLSSLLDVTQFCKIRELQLKAWNLFEKSFTPIYQTFVSQDQQGIKIKHSTTQEKNYHYSENYIFLAELCLRVFELSGDESFKTQFFQIMTYIKNHFYKDNKVLTRSHDLDTADHPNEELSVFDQSYKSPLATFIGLCRKAHVLSADLSWNQDFAELVEYCKKFVLNFPYGGGEMLRSLNYPDQAYRVIKAPVDWLSEDKFRDFARFFLPRFTFDFHKDPHDKWEICGPQQCEMQGQGLEEFIQKLSPSQQG